MRIPFIRYNHQKHLDDLAKIPQDASQYRILFDPNSYRIALLDSIYKAQHRIYIIALYLEQDEAGQEILNALYQAKKQKPNLDIKIFVDWHRAQRGRFGEDKNQTNARYYNQMKQQHPDIDIPVYGVPINRREVLGVLHLKGLIIDDTVIYSGASINNVYLHKFNKYRYDRYHFITNKTLADCMIKYVNDNFLPFEGLQRLDVEHHKTRKQIKAEIKTLRQHLSEANYQYESYASNNELTVSPIAGLGRNNSLNKIIHHLINTTQHNVIFCTPYFNLPNILVRDIIRLLRKGRQVEIIIGDKEANDFYIPPDKPFNISGGLPYLYEINLRNFIERLQPYIDKQQLIIRLWKDEDQTYHLKGVWVDNQWMLITGNNLNPRAWRLDLENGILVHDPKQELQKQIKQELDTIRQKTTLVTHFQQIQASQFYPKQVHKLIKRLSRIRVDRIIKRLL
ncbi:MULTISPECIES: CDP-diacylglycerol--serine O-phosphatidyltransferase [unclassified Gilliamella]|uniref:CDP-diacylglycerol--serine O-phosphatidyltransferase n=1 Tax=unclassified Gilliamella TaxID=2685620 RepID=UPI00226AAA64|nr:MULTISPECIES: CDP-diacylglycerol--serine O-phosphatidyltransferase [unclassified Gilliamella]MCX8641837.1 CDP-diacylglycerol--serine O-phosphatidyltransferase [Gilliamella sp. B3835]MCX8706637.1 CDP-diacylglycerol--serine O-phosphatidyltransferase [Gilliamella sp. B3783]MCX8708894.1 CDP-diacylglycerol--serine O-phosphatidyltransferase [Gilliamella sp. B3780]MCX8713113.1 CDP-diacylglycerol--serine O-phosphatidyltransferase [Gilliamella sp. B3468]MCX8713678.1 CDP-diacylglycerol--serine O-phos